MKLLRFVAIIIALGSAGWVGISRTATQTPASTLPAAWLQDFLSGPSEKKEVRIGDLSITVRIFSLNDPTASRYGLRVVLVTVPLNSYALMIEDVRQHGNPATVFSSVASKNEDFVLVNGGYYGVSGSSHFYPLGLIVNNGKRVSFASKWKSGGVLVAMAASGARIIPIRDFTYGPAIKQAVQSKPLLVEHFHLGIRRDDQELANRTAVAIDTDGSVIVAGAFNANGKALTLYEFAQVLINQSGARGTSIEYALNMDGGPGAHIFIPALNLHFGTDAPIYVPNLIRLKAHHE